MKLKRYCPFSLLRERETNKDRAIELQRNRYIDILISILEGDISLKLETSHELEDEEILTVLPPKEDLQILLDRNMAQKLT